MKNSRISRPMIVAILVMFGAWLALGFFLNGRQTDWASGFFFRGGVPRLNQASRTGGK